MNARTEGDIAAFVWKLSADFRPNPWSGRAPSISDILDSVRYGWGVAGAHLAASLIRVH